MFKNLPLCYRIYFHAGRQLLTITYLGTGTRLEGGRMGVGGGGGGRGTPYG